MLKFVRDVMHVGKWMPFTVVGARISSLLLKNSARSLVRACTPSNSRTFSIAIKPPHDARFTVGGNHRARH